MPKTISAGVRVTLDDRDTFGYGGLPLLAGDAAAATSIGIFVLTPRSLLPFGYRDGNRFPLVHALVDQGIGDLDRFLVHDLGKAVVNGSAAANRLQRDPRYAPVGSGEIQGAQKGPTAGIAVMMVLDACMQRWGR